MLTVVPVRCTSFAWPIFLVACLCAMTQHCIAQSTAAPRIDAAADSQVSNLNDLPYQLHVPEVVSETPAAGKRVWQQLDAYRDWKVRHVLYLPSDWSPQHKYPVIFEYPGNGNYRNKLGDTSEGTVEGCRLGYGLSQGKQAIWVCLPFVDPKSRAHATQWWGDADETVRYAKLAIDLICRDYGGDSQRLFLAGFSRGALACSYIGLRDDEIAGKWRGLFAHSHYDGVRKWNYADCDVQSALVRIRRFQQRPQWISHEKSVDDVRDFFQTHQLAGDHILIRALPYPNHTPDWLLKDTALGEEARTWFRQQAGLYHNPTRKRGAAPGDPSAN